MTRHSHQKAVLSNYRLYSQSRINYLFFCFIDQERGIFLKFTIIEPAFKKALLENGYTLTELCTRAGISFTTLNKIVSKHQSVRVSTCNKIADALSKPVTELFE